MNKEEKENMGGYVGNTDAHTLSPVNPCVYVQILRIESKQKLEATFFFGWLVFSYFQNFSLFFKCSDTLLCNF